LSGNNVASKPELFLYFHQSEYGLRAWKLYFGDEDPATLTPETLSEKLVELTQRGTKSKGDRYQPDVLLYFFLGIQQHLRTNGRPDQFFYETLYTPFVVSFTAYAEQEMSKGKYRNFNSIHVFLHFSILKVVAFIYSDNSILF